MRNGGKFKQKLAEVYKALAYGKMRKREVRDERVVFFIMFYYYLPGRTLTILRVNICISKTNVYKQTKKLHAEVFQKALTIEAYYDKLYCTPE